MWIPDLRDFPKSNYTKETTPNGPIKGRPPPSSRRRESNRSSTNGRLSRDSWRFLRNSSATGEESRVFMLPRPRRKVRNPRRTVPESSGTGGRSNFRRFVSRLMTRHSDDTITKHRTYEATTDSFNTSAWHASLFKRADTPDLEWWLTSGNDLCRNEERRKNRKPTAYHARLIESPIELRPRPPKQVSLQHAIMKMETEARKVIQELEKQSYIIDDPSPIATRDHGPNEPRDTRIALAKKSHIRYDTAWPISDATISVAPPPPHEQERPVRKRRSDNVHAWTMNDPFVVDLRRGEPYELVRKLRRDTFLNFHQGPNFSYRDRDTYIGRAKYDKKDVPTYTTSTIAKPRSFQRTGTNRDGVHSPLRRYLLEESNHVNTKKSANPNAVKGGRTKDETMRYKELLQFREERGLAPPREESRPPVLLHAANKAELFNRAQQSKTNGKKKRRKRYS